jgi:ATP-dependent RNA/DNA helicase IGHMBP2
MINNELLQLQKLLQMEKEEEIRQFDELINKTPLQERIRKGACWYPIQLDSWGWSLGEHPYIIIERLKQKDMPHRFREGQVISVFQEQQLKGNDAEHGVVHWIDKNRMKIIFYGTDIPNWVLHNQIGVQLNFDDRSYDEMVRAVKLVMDAKGTRLAELRDILMGKEEARFDMEHYAYDLPKLNKSQNDAVNKILSAKDVAIVHGPPGTGKTTTLVAAIEQLVKRENPILVCAPSNPATDLLTEKLAEKKLRVVRIGNVSRVDESLLEHTIEGILQEHPGMQEVKRMKIEAAQIRRQAEKFKRTFGFKEREERKEQYQEARQLIQHAKILEDYIIDQVLKEAHVITCTLVSSMNSYIEKMRFHTVVIDEAAQALEPATWIPICKAERVILAGDPFQLPPTVKSIDAARGGLSVTLLEKCVKRMSHVQLLNIQYRMNEEIMGFSNRQFYHNQLQASEYVAKWRLMTAEGEDIFPVEFIDTAGCGFEEQLNAESLSYCNPEEYGILRLHLDKLLSLSGEQKISIGIISPYKEQVNYMAEHIKNDFDHFPDADLTVDTIDSFQGQERDVIYISMVRCNDKNEIGFLKDTRRMNVAMTRARKKLVVIGDSVTLGSFSFYADFLDYVQKNDMYTTAWDWT